MVNVIVFKRREIKMMCNEAGQPVYLEGVEWSDLNLRERMVGELVHLRDEPGEPCHVCGVRSGVWTSSDSSHAIHSAKCRL